MAGLARPDWEMRQKTTQIIQLTQLAPPKRSQFGEFLVQQNVLDRFQLFRTLQMQDRVPNARLGQCAVTLGYVPGDAIEQLHARFAAQVNFEQMATEAFSRDPIETIPAMAR